jgi:prevent-host-death family protein
VTKLLAKEVFMSADAARQFNIHDAKTNSSRIIERVEHGEEIVICRAGTPVAKVVPLTRRVDRAGRRGSLRGKLVMAPDWDSDEVNDAIAGDFGVAP